MDSPYRENLFKMIYLFFQLSIHLFVIYLFTYLFIYLFIQWHNSRDNTKNDLGWSPF